MSELKTVKVGVIDPNPFRNLDEWPTIRDKVEELKASMTSTGFWDGYMIVRKSGGRYEQAFGHHRLVAFKELYGPDKAITVNVQALDNDKMFSMMVNENSETYGQRFYYAVMQPIAALVKAYAEGAIKLEAPHLGERVRWDRIRKAPSFLAGTAKDSTGSGLYTADTVAVYLGWNIVRNDRKSGVQAADRVLTAISALELIENKAFKQSDVVDMTQSEVAGLVLTTKARVKAEEAGIDATVSVKTAALKKAEREGDTNTVQQLETQLADIESEKEKRLKQMGKTAAKEYVT